MMKKNILSLILVVVIILILVLILFARSPAKDIDVKVLDIYDENNQYFVNVSMTNNQDKTGWISDTYLTTVEGNSISLTGAGIDEKLDPGETIELTLFSAEIYDSIIDPPLKLAYTAFPSGNTYSVDI